VRAAKRRYPLAPGETAVAALAASDRAQARLLFSYASAPFTSPLRAAMQPLADLVTRRTRWELNLANNVSIEVSTSNFRAIRGRTFAIAIADELAFWQDDEGQNPASEILSAIRPALATLGGQLIGLSSPFAKAGALWDVYARSWGKDDAHTLVWKAPTRVMNPSIPERVVQEALERDEQAARAEWLAEFRDDVAALVTPEALRAVVISERRHDLPRLADVDYLAVVDAASGSGADSAALAIVHAEIDGDRVIVVVDAVREAKPPFSPELVVAEHAALLRAYGCLEVYGDKWGAGFVDALYARHGIWYRALPMTRSEAYAQLLGLVNCAAVELPEHPRLIQQISRLRRTAGTSGREVIDHPAGGHDDIANATAAACVLMHQLGSAPQPVKLGFAL
jgi:hypothetical protein